MKFYILILCSICFAAFSCDDAAELETIDELSIEAYLHAGDTLDSIRLTKVLPFQTELSDYTPDNLTPIIKTETGDSYLLNPLGTEGYYGSDDLKIEEGEVYSFEVKFNGKTISSETFIPTVPTGLTVSAPIVYRDKIRDFSDIQNQELPDLVEISWDGEEGAFYFVNVRNITSNLEIINELFEGFEPPGSEDILTEPSNSSNYDINPFRDITHYGRYEVTVYRVNPEYVVLYEDNTSGVGSLNQIATNVQNGFGIFTGINSKKIYFDVKK